MGKALMKPKMVGIGDDGWDYMLGRAERQLGRATSKKVDGGSSFRVLVALDGSGSMTGPVMDAACKTAYLLGRKEVGDPAFQVRIVLCNSTCRDPLLLKDYGRRFDKKGLHVLRTFVSNGGGEGFDRSARYLRNDDRPDLALFLTDGMLEMKDIEWLREMQEWTALRVVYVGQISERVRSYLAESFGRDGYIAEQSGNEVASWLDRMRERLARLVQR